MSYLRFAAMIATSTVVMFGLMYLNTFELEQGLEVGYRGFYSCDVT